MMIFEIVKEYYEEHPMTIEQWEQENETSHDDPEIDWSFSFSDE